MKRNRSLCYSVAASLDGFIAGPQGEYDWIPMDPDIDFGALVGHFDTILMGRGTWEVVAARDGGGGGPFGLKSYVVSRTLRPADHPGVEIISGDLEHAVKQLKSAPGKDIWLFGGAALCGSLLEAGLVDVVEVAVIPVILAGGIPLVSAGFRARKLALEEHRIYPKTGIALLNYRVVR